ncbi:hypothetical protein N7495_001180 [Penicillium taxi]|uniref:uncharacterized protein n=1 Tax=Penicillium taxi TaxID=168475 RepID=UPI0025450E4E|nr:uncharacterized protein N7495_001180 [Penicillium taxi]KAJ5908498.1 hypothetical protein N7495_001180 [Penicillium taxi]
MDPPWPKLRQKVVRSTEYSDDLEIDAQDWKISLSHAQTDEEALEIVQKADFFSQSAKSFIILTDVSPELGSELLNLLDERYPRVRKGFFLEDREVTLKMPSYTHDAPHMWLHQQLTKWEHDGLLTGRENLRLLLGSSPKVTCVYPPFVGSSKEPDTFICPRGLPLAKRSHPTVVIEVGMSQSHASLKRDAKLWLEGVGTNVKKVLIVKFFTTRPGVKGNLEKWGRDTTGLAQLEFSNHIFPVRGPFERPVYLKREDLFNSVVEAGCDGADHLPLDIHSLRDIICESGLEVQGLQPAV